MAALTYPVMPGYDARAHGINMHFQGTYSTECGWVRNNIYRWGDDHYGFGCVVPRRGDAETPAALVDQYELLLPHVRMVRPIINLYGLGELGEMNDRTDAVWTEFASRGWKILLTGFDGPNQRFYDAARGPERNTLNWIRRQEYLWNKLADYLDGNPLVKSAIWAVQPQNEPAAYNQMRSAGASMDEGYLIGVTNYARMCDAVCQIVHDRISPTLPISIGGFQWDGLQAPLYDYEMPHFGGKNAVDHLTSKYPTHKFYISLHDNWGQSAHNDLWAYEDGNMVTNRRISWKQAVRNYTLPVLNTEILGLRNNGLADMPVVEGDIPQNVKMLDLSYWLGVSRWWWPFSNISKARLCDLGTESKPRNLNRFCLGAITSMYCYPQNPLYFHGPQNGIKDEHSSDSHSFEAHSINWTDMEKTGWGADLPRPANHLRHTTYYGGTGTCRIDVTDDQLNAVMGGDGRTIVNCGQSSFDMVFLGRGGGVVRAPGGHNYIMTRWNPVRIYAGAGVNYISCWVPKTPWPRINRLPHGADIVLDPAGRHYIYDWPNGDNRISFKGAFPDWEALSDACTLRPPTNSGESQYYSHELVIALPRGGEVVFSHGLESWKRLLSHNLDLRHGWYGPGWVEPPDYDPAELSAAPADPEYDLLYDLDMPEGAGIWLGPDGQPLPVFDHLGNPIQMELAA